MQINKFEYADDLHKSVSTHSDNQLCKDKQFTLNDIIHLKILSRLPRGTTISITRPSNLNTRTNFSQN